MTRFKRLYSLFWKYLLQDLLQDLTSELEADVVVIPHPVTEITVVSGTKPIVDVGDSGSEPIPLVLKTLQELKNENQVVISHLDKHDEILKEQAKTNTKIEGMLQAILSRLPPPS